MSAEYLFMQDKLYDVQYDTGDKVIQCGRHNDIFKLWLQWRAKVLQGALVCSDKFKFLFYLLHQ
jgi:glutamate decarboxylase